MDSGMIAKIEKAVRYAQERHRIRFDSFQVTFQGNHALHHTSFQAGRWTCDCGFFVARGVCSHSMALERVLEGMIPEVRQEQLSGLA